MSAMESPATAAVVIIGAEVLSGKVEDENGPFLIRALRQRGIEVTEIRIVPDVLESIGHAVIELSKTATYVFTSGGIGPTHDDVTVEAVARAFGRQLVRDPDLARLLAERHKEKLNAARLKMADVPEGASVHLGPHGFVPVVQIENVTVLPGVPSLLRTCFEQVAPRLTGRPFYGRALLLDASEGDIAHELTEVQRVHPEVAIGSYPQFDEPRFRVKVTVDGRDEAAVAATIAALKHSLDARWIVGEE